MADPSKPISPGADRGNDGRYLPGHAPGPGKRAMDPEVKAMLLAATPKAARVLIDALDAKCAVVAGSRIEFVADMDLRLKASTAIFDRLYGRPSQAITSEEGGPIKVDISVIEKLQKLLGDGGHTP